jgi:hypothetical protein
MEPSIELEPNIQLEIQIPIKLDESIISPDNNNTTDISKQSIYHIILYTGWIISTLFILYAISLFVVWVFIAIIHYRYDIRTGCPNSTPNCSLQQKIYCYDGSLSCFLFPLLLMIVVCPFTAGVLISCY